jgi:hypothetical protein
MRGAIQTDADRAACLTHLLADCLRPIAVRAWFEAKTTGLVHHSDRGVQGGFKRSSQHSLCWPIEAIGHHLLHASRCRGVPGVGMRDCQDRRLDIDRERDPVAVLSGCLEA